MPQLSSKTSVEEVVFRPNMRLSKSVPSPFVGVEVPFIALAPKFIKSDRAVPPEVLEEPSSCNLRVCSCSIRDDKDLISPMND